MSKKTLRSRAAKTLIVIGILVGVGAGFLALLISSAGLFGKLPFWAAAILMFVSLVVLLAGAASLAHHLRSPRHWLVLAAVGALILIVPLLVLAVHGSWDAEFRVPRRGAGTYGVTVRELAWLATPSGLGILITGLVAYVRARIKRRSKNG